MNWNELHFIAVLGFLVLLTLGPVFAWPQTRKLTPLVLLSYILFLVIQWDFVAGPLMPFHDTAWNLEGWSIIIQQWVYSGEALEWNPYLGAGQPFALYNNVLSSLPSVFFAWLFKTLGLPFDPTPNFKLIWIFGHLNICSGSLLFFRLLFRENWVALLGFSSMLFGGYFFMELGQGVAIYTLSFLPYMLFFLVVFYRERTWTPLLLFSLFLGMSVNYYIPTYMFYTLTLFFIAVLLVTRFRSDLSLREEVRSVFNTVRSKIWMMVPAVLLVLVAAGPMLFNYLEIQDYASPTRGFSTNTAKTTDYTHQGGVSVPLEAYGGLVNPRLQTWTDLHSAFYIGLLPCLAVVASLLVGGHRIFLLLSLFLIILSAQSIFGFPFWQWFRHYVPLGDTLRHTFMFARLAAFFLLTASLAGLLALKNGPASTLRKIAAVVLAAGLWAGLFADQWTPDHQILMVLAAVSLIVLVASRLTPKKYGPLLCLVVVMCFQAVDMIGTNLNHAVPQALFWKKFSFPRGYTMNAIAYPERWQVRPEYSIPVPQYFQSTYRKEAIWSNLFPDTMLWLQKDMAMFLLHQRFLDASANTFIPSSYVYLNLRNAEGKLFHVLPTQPGKKVDALSLQALKEILNANRPLLETVQLGFGEEPGVGSKVQNIKAGTEGGPVFLNQPIWVSYSIQEGFQPDQLKIVGWPEDLPRHSPIVEVWVSEDLKAWHLFQRLNMEDAVVDPPNEIWTFPLNRPITSPHFKLILDQKDFNSVSKVNLVETRVHPDAAGVPEEESVLLAGKGHLVQRPSSSSSRVTVDLDLPRDAYILKLENYHKNWTATLDGEDIPITRVHPNFQTVRVPAGKHVLTFQFESMYPKLVLLHIVTGVLGGLVLLGWLAGVRLDRFRQWVPPLRQTTQTEP